MKLRLIVVMFRAMMTKRHLNELRDLGRKKFREAEGRFLVEGLRMAEEAAESDFEIQEVLFTGEVAGSIPGRELLKKLHRRTGLLQEVTEREINALSDTITSQGIILVVAARRSGLESLQHTGRPLLLVGLDAVSDPGNLGSMIRTCDWFGVNGVLLGRGCVEVYNPKAVRSTMGSLFHIPIVENVNLPAAIGAMKSSGYAVYVADAAGEVSAEHAQFPERTLIILGNEAHGISPSLRQSADARVSIRRYGRAESLNVGVACGVLLSAFRTAWPRGENNDVHH